MQAKLTLIGMYKWDNTIFDNIVLPENANKDIVINTILLNDGEFELLYPDFDFLKFTINQFFIKHYWTFDKIFKAINIEYNPLENYDRMETETTSGTSKNTETNSGTDGRSINYTEGGRDVTTNTETNSGSDTSEKIGQVSAFDSSSFSDRDKENTTNTYGRVITDNGNINYGKTETTQDNFTHGHKRINDIENDNERNIRAHGNIGVTTSQQMLQSELDIALYNAYDMIAYIFADEMCVRTF